MKIADQDLPHESTRPTTDENPINNREKNAKYFTQETLDQYVDTFDRNCEVRPCWVCGDIKKQVTRENQGLCPVVGFG